MDFNYESPITKIEQELAGQIVETEEGKLMYEVKKATGYSIEKEELIKALQYDRQQYEKGYNDGYNANKWISVKERLPEKNIEVLATTVYDLITIAERYSENDWFIAESYGNADTDEIVAWMPLPEPYKAESESEQ